MNRALELAGSDSDLIWVTDQMIKISCKATTTTALQHISIYGEDIHGVYYKCIMQKFSQYGVSRVAQSRSGKIASHPES